MVWLGAHRIANVLLLPIVWEVAFALPGNAATFTPLGDLQGGAVWSEAADVAAHGLVVVGTSESALGTEAFRWTPAAGLRPLGDFAGGPFHSEALGVSHDGEVIVGFGSSDPYPDGGPFRLAPGGTLEGSGLDLPYWAGSGVARDLSADGSIVVGSGLDPSFSPGRDRALKWADSIDPMQIYSDIAARAQGVSADGSTIVGSATTSCFFGCNHVGVRWSSDTSFDELNPMDLVEATSGDGSVVVGYTAGSSGGADRWTETTGVVHLGPGRAHDVSADGSIVVGSGANAFVWDATHGYRDLKTFLETDHCLDLTGWTLSAATAISPDGTVIVGTGVNPSGETEAWMVQLQQRVDGPPAECLDYVALGDSFSSGEGLSDYELETAIPGSNTCHRSRRSYPHRIQNAGGAAIHLFKDRLLACSGARVVNVEQGGAGPVFAPAEGAQLDRTVAGDPETPIVNPSTDMVTITIGGNDVLFAKLLRWCAEEPGCGAPGYRPIPGIDISLHEIAFELLDALGPKLNMLFGQIRSQTEGNAAIFVLGYPNVLPQALDQEDDFCEALGAAFDSVELSYLRFLGRELNDRIERAAQESGVHFVSVAEGFDGREMCTGSGPEWIFRPALGVSLDSEGDLSVIHRRSFHPNVRGHVEYAKALVEYMQGLGPGWPTLPSGLPDNPEPTAAATLLAAEAAVEDPVLVSLGPLFVQPEPSIGCDSRGRFVPGQAMHIVGGGYAPGAMLLVRVKSVDGYSADLATVSASSGGSVDATVTLPATAPAAGVGVLEVHGTRADGGHHILEAGMGFASSVVDDADGDGVPDVCDVCPSDVDAGQTDMDGDGVGDACDPCAADPDNDFDGDGLCAGADPCEFTEINDPDGDGVCTESLVAVPLWPPAWMIVLILSIGWAGLAGCVKRQQ